MISDDQNEFYADPDDVQPVNGIRQLYNVVQWHVMRVSYHREQKVSDYLTPLGWECYVPQKTVLVLDAEGNSTKRVVDLLPNIIFIKASWRMLYELKSSLPHDYPLHYIIDHTKPGNVPLVVPDKMMEDFIHYTTQHADSLLWLDHPEDVFTKGRRVRVVFGPLAGCEGYVLRIKRNKRFVLSLNGFVSAAVMNADCRHDWMEPID